MHTCACIQFINFGLILSSVEYSLGCQLPNHHPWCLRKNGISSISFLFPFTIIKNNAVYNKAVGS